MGKSHPLNCKKDLGHCEPFISGRAKLHMQDTKKIRAWGCSNDPSWLSGEKKHHVHLYKGAGLYWWVLLCKSNTDVSTLNQFVQNKKYIHDLVQQAVEQFCEMLKLCSEKQIAPVTTLLYRSWWLVYDKAWYTYIIVRWIHLDLFSLNKRSQFTLNLNW